MKNWDNALLNINGEHPFQLKQALLMALAQITWEKNDKEQQFVGWYFSEEHGMLIAPWLPNDRQTPFNIFTTPLSVDEMVTFAWDWIQHHPDARKVPLLEWEDDPRDIDVDTDIGFRLYVEDWGHVGNDHLALCAIKRVFLWYGK